MGWPQPNSTGSLREFLGLSGYYCQFIKDYGGIARPLTNLLKKFSFQWTTESSKAFEELKKAMSQPPVLAFPNSMQTFYVEYDASRIGVGAVLTQMGRSIAYFSKAIKGECLSYSAYEKELLALVLGR